jgi:hypothetical protein
VQALRRYPESRVLVASPESAESSNAAHGATLPSTTGNVSPGPAAATSHSASPRPASRTENRREPRFKVFLPVQIWGMNAHGDEFAQAALVRDISTRGALLVDVDQDLRCGDLIGLRCNGRAARFRVVWTRTVGLSRKASVAVQRLESDLCPWADSLTRLTSPTECP